MPTPIRRSRRLFAVACTALATTLALSGCAGVTAPQTGSSSATSSTMLFAGDNGSPNFTRNFNPYNPTRRTGAFHIYEPLIVLNTINGTVTPFLASKVEQSDPKTAVFEIRQGVKWSDGKPFTAADVKFTFDLLKKYPALDLQGAWQHLSSVEVSGQQVIMHYKSADVPATNIVGQTLIVPQHLWDSVKSPVSYADENPIGTGPYTLGTFGANQYTLVKNASYWQADKVAADKLIIPASNTQLDLVNKGYDWAYAYISDVQKTWVSAHQGNTYWFPPGGTISLFPNLTKAPFNDVNMRRGLSLALKRQAIAQTAEEGYVDPATQTGLLLPGQQALLNPDLPNGGAVAQNTSAALAAFSKAGYTKQGNKLVDSSGKQLSLTITTANGYTDWLRGVQEVQRQLQAIGIVVHIDQPQPAAYNQALDNGKFELAMGGFGGTGSVYQDMHQLLSSDFYQPIGTSASSNFERFKNTEVDSLLDQLKAAQGADEQKKISQQLQQQVYDQVPVIAMFYGGLWGLFSNKQFTGWPSASNPYATPITYNQNVLLIDTHLQRAQGQATQGK